jgi:hypothetical protein
MGEIKKGGRCKLEIERGEDGKECLSIDKRKNIDERKSEGGQETQGEDCLQDELEKSEGTKGPTATRQRLCRGGLILAVVASVSSC